MLMREKFEGRPYYRFDMDGVPVYVARGNAFAALYIQSENILSVMAAPGTSYHQSALRARRALNRGKFKTLEEMTS